MDELQKSFRKNILQVLEADDPSGIDRYEAFDCKGMEFHEYVELTHEYLDLLSFKLRESKSKMDKDMLAGYIFSFIKKAIKEYDFNEKFVSSQCKTLVTYYKNQKDLDNAILVLEFLIFYGITENSGPGYHIQLDELYRLRKKRRNRERRQKDQAG